MKIVFLDRQTIGADIDLSSYNSLGEVIMYDFSTSQEVPERIQDADVIVITKILVNEGTVGNAKKLKLVCVTATGTDNLDKDYLASRNIAWRNVAGYSTESVAQHTFAMLFYLLEKLRYYDEYVKEKHYVEDKMFTHFQEHYFEIKGKTWGIVGLGDIGRRVATLATAFGAHVIYYSPSGSNRPEAYTQVDFDTLLTTSDILSVHAPLTKDTLGLMDASAFSKMKETAIFINVGRGPIVVEEDLVYALNEGQLAAAGLDVLSQEPMTQNHPFLTIQDSKKLFITPHIAWASVEARTKLMALVLKNITDFFNC